MESKMKAYGVKHKNEVVRSKSRSGGAFVAITDAILKKGGIVFGCKMISPYRAIHSFATTAEERNSFCGSKYIQSELLVDGKHIFYKVQEYLERDQWVAFSGTPCQVKALSNYLAMKEINTKKLILIDIACHGVPSARVWTDLVHFFEKRFRTKAIRVDFRDKKRYGWAAHWETIETTNGYVHSKAFRNMFYEHYILRPSCYSCKCKVMPYASDFTLADFWGANQVVPTFDDNKGVSLVFVNTTKGEKLFSEIQENLEVVECNIHSVIQPMLIESVKKPEDRDSFWENYYKLGIEKIINMYAGRSVKNRILEKLPNYLVRKLHREKTIEWERK